MKASSTRPPIDPHRLKKTYKHRGIASYIGRQIAIALILIIILFIVDLFILFFSFIYVNYDAPVEPSFLIEEAKNDLRDSHPNEEIDDIKDPQLSEDFIHVLKEQNSWIALYGPDGRLNYISPNAQPDVSPKNATELAIAARRGSYKDSNIYVMQLHKNNSEGFDNTLIVLGKFDKDATMRPLLIYKKTIEENIKLAIVLIILDFIIIFAVYVIYRRSIDRSITPITQAISLLAKSQAPDLHLDGELAVIADEINDAGRALQRKDRARSNWITGISHDIRTPLVTVLGYSEQMAHDPGLPEKTRREASYISKQGLKMRDLIEDLNVASHLEYDLDPCKAKKIKLARFMRQLTCEFLDKGLDGVEFDLKLSPDVELVETMADERLLKRAIQNLVSNAITHNKKQISQAGLRIDFDLQLISKAPLEAEGPYISIKVSDNGAGCNQETLARLNMGPRNLEEAFQKNHDGIAAHGLGLILVRGIADVHHGCVNFKAKENLGFSGELILPIFNAAIPHQKN